MQINNNKKIYIRLKIIIYIIFIFILILYILNKDESKLRPFLNYQNNFALYKNDWSVIMTDNNIFKQKIEIQSNNVNPNDVKLRLLINSSNGEYLLFNDLILKKGQTIELPTIPANSRSWSLQAIPINNIVTDINNEYDNYSFLIKDSLSKYNFYIKKTT